MSALVSGTLLILLFMSIAQACESQTNFKLIGCNTVLFSYFSVNHPQKVHKLLQRLMCHVFLSIVSMGMNM